MGAGSLDAKAPAQMQMSRLATPPREDAVSRRARKAASASNVVDVGGDGATADAQHDSRRETAPERAKRAEVDYDDDDDFDLSSVKLPSLLGDLPSLLTRAPAA